ncbi:MAG: cell division protein FtsQ/DivIB [Pseudomonadota bacterium]
MALICFAMVWAFSDEDRRMAMRAWGEDLKRQVEERPEFMVTLLAVDGASSSVAADIRESLPIHLPSSSFDLDLEALREEVGKVPAVASADVRIKTGGVLEVIVRERVPVALWRGPDGLAVLSRDGTVVGDVAQRTDRPDLPLLVGQSAAQDVGGALDIIRALDPFADRVRGLVRVGERRWDIVLDRDQTIQLPSQDPVRAVERVIALDRAQDLMARDIAVIDLRNQDRATVRLTADAVSALRAIRLIETGQDREGRQQ